MIAGTDQNNDIPLSPGTISQLDAHIAGSEHSSNAQSAAQPSPASPAHGPAAASDAPGSDENGIGPPECPLETLEDLDEVLSRFAPFFTWSDPFGSMTETGNVVTEPAPSPSFSPAVAHASQPTGSSIPQSARTQPQSQPGPGVHSSSNSGGRSTLGAAVWPPARVAPEAELSSMQHVQADTNSNVRPGSPVPHPQGNAMPTRTYVGQQAEFQTPTSEQSKLAAAIASCNTSACPHVMLLIVLCHYVVPMCSSNLTLSKVHGSLAC